MSFQDKADLVMVGTLAVIVLLALLGSRGGK